MALLKEFLKLNTYQLFIQLVIVVDLESIFQTEGINEDQRLIKQGMVGF